MSEFTPVQHPSDLRFIDDGEALQGFQAGQQGTDEPGNLYSRSYWHGWCNGRVVAGFDDPSPAQRAMRTWTTTPSFSLQ